MKKQIVFSLIIGLLLCFYGGCCGSGQCPYCSINLNYDNYMKPNQSLYCRECQSTFLVTENCGTCPIEGQYDAKRVEAARQNQARRASAYTYTPVPFQMVSPGSYVPGYRPPTYQQPSYQQQPAYQPLNPYEGFQDFKAAMDFVDGK